MQTLHDMLFALRDRVQGATPAQGLDPNAAVTVSFQAGEWQALMQELDASAGAQRAAAGEQQMAQMLRSELDVTAAENQALRRELDAVKSAIAAPAPAPAPTEAPAPAPAPAPAAVVGSMPPVPDAPLV